MICGKAECGILYAVKRGGSSVAYCALSTRCGTRDEDGFNKGIAHFAEHTIFKGTTHKSASTISSYLDNLGGELNAFTTKEEIVLHSTVLKEDLPKAASLLMELATCPTFPQQETDIERGVVIEEIQSYKDCPSDDIYDQFETLLFEGHALSSPILGTVDSVRRISSEELKRFVSEKFKPEAMTFTVVADIDEKKLEAQVLKLMAKWFAGHKAGAAIAGVKPEGCASYCLPEPMQFNKTIVKNNHEANAVTGHLAPSLYEEKDRVCAILLGNILAGPASNSILNRALRERNGWVYGVESSYTQYSDTGLMTISLGCEKQNLDKCLKAMDKEISKLQNRTLSPSRLKAYKKQLLGQLAISSDNGESQCLSMSKSLTAYGSIASDNSVRNLIESVTAEEIKNMACSIFDKSKLSTLIFI